MAKAFSSYFSGRLIFNDEAWTGYMGELPRTKTYAFMKSGVVRRNAKITEAFGKQTGSFSQRMPIYGTAEATEDNYDGATDMPDPGYQDSYSRAVVAYGRQFSLAEKDFSYDLIPGQKFEEVLRKHIQTNRDNAFERRLLNMTNMLFTFPAPEPEATETPEHKFAESHTMDISETDPGAIDATTLNNACQKAAREFKGDFTMVAMHSQVATNLENLKLLEYAKGVDANGVIKDLGFATWNGKQVVIDDSLPVTPVEGGGNKYTTYVYGKGAFEYSDLPVKTPYEPVRDAKKAIDMMYIRYREVLAPMGFSYEGIPASMSPTEDELKDAGNWKLAFNNDGDTFPIERIPIARIVSKG